jgi:hypothetical protein
LISGGQGRNFKALLLHRFSPYYMLAIFSFSFCTLLVASGPWLPLLVTKSFDKSRFTQILSHWRSIPYSSKVWVVELSVETWDQLGFSTHEDWLSPNFIPWITVAFFLPTMLHQTKLPKPRLRCHQQKLEGLIEL